MAALQDNYRCARLTLPGFDLSQPSRVTSLAPMSELLCQVLDRVSQWLLATFQTERPA